MITRYELLAVVAVLTFGCAEEPKRSGPVADPPALGEYCGTDPGCTEGICSRDIFDQQCSAQCMTGADCAFLTPGTDCFSSWCAIPCALSSDCPANTTCQSVGGKMACKAN